MMNMDAAVQFRTMGLPKADRSSSMKLWPWVADKWYAFVTDRVIKEELTHGQLLTYISWSIRNLDYDLIITGRQG